MADRAEHMASSVENAAEAVKNSAAVIPLIHFISKVFSPTQGKKKK